MQTVGESKQEVDGLVWDRHGEGRMGGEKCECTVRPIGSNAGVVALVYEVCEFLLRISLGMPRG